MVSSRGKSKGCLAIFVERKTRFYWAIKIPDRSAKSMQLAIETFLRLVPIGRVKTFSVDRGKEFGCYKYIENQLGIPVYFADLILLGNVVLTKTQTAYFVSFTLKNTIYLLLMNFNLTLILC